MRQTVGRRRDSLRAACSALGATRRSSLLVASAAAIVLTFGLAPAAGAAPTTLRSAAAASSDPGTESAFVASVNGVRQSHGLAPLQVYGELVGIARGWSDHMAGVGGISHNPNLSGAVSAPWRKLGENVGVGYDVSGLMSAFVNSPAHYKNIVDPQFNYIGVGVSYGADGRMYTTHDFMYVDEGGDPPAAPAPPAPPAPSKHARSVPEPAPEPAPPVASDPPPPPPPPPSPPPPPADPARVHAVLTALRTVSS